MTRRPTSDERRQWRALLREAATRNDDWCAVPDRGLRALERYVMAGVRPGEFLCAILANDLRGAVVRADETNLKLLPQWVRLLQEYVPLSCWGSGRAVEEWLRREDG